MIYITLKSKKESFSEIRKLVRDKILRLKYSRFNFKILRLIYRIIYKIDLRTEFSLKARRTKKQKQT